MGDLLDEYNKKVLQPNLPPGQTIDFRPIGNGQNAFDDPNTVCALGSAPEKRIIALGTYQDGSTGVIPRFSCYTTNKDYFSTPEILTDVLQLLRSKGTDINAYERGDGNLSRPATVQYLDDNIINDGGAVSQQIVNWLKTQTAATPPPDPCALIH